MFSLGSHDGSLSIRNRPWPSPFRPIFFVAACSVCSSGAWRPWPLAGAQGTDKGTRSISPGGTGPGLRPAQSEGAWPWTERPPQAVTVAEELCQGQGHWPWGRAEPAGPAGPVPIPRGLGVMNCQASHFTAVCSLLPLPLPLSLSWAHGNRTHSAPRWLSRLRDAGGCGPGFPV